MDKITLKEIRALKPWYDLDIYLKEDWSGTLVDFLHIEAIPSKDRIWVAVRLMPRFLVDVFAIDCAFAANAADQAATYDTTYYAATSAYYAANASYGYASAYASAYAAAAATTSRTQERENQIDALIMLLEGE